jgi:hypothetical protein
MPSQVPSLVTDETITYILRGSLDNDGQSVDWPNGAKSNNFAYSDIISPTSILFADAANRPAWSIRIDNPTPVEIFLPLTGETIQAFTSGNVINFLTAQSVIQVQGLVVFVAIVPSGAWTLTIRLSSKLDAPKPGAGQSNSTYAILVDNNGYPYNSSAAVQKGNLSPNSIYTTNGYDPFDADQAWLVPARTPNVYATLMKSQAAATSITTNAYTAPAFQYWRLMALRVLCDSPGPGASIAVLENGAQRGGFYAFEGQWAFPAGGARGFREVRYRGNGLKANGTGTSLTVQVGSGGSTLTFLEAEAELYVGP